MRLPIAAAVLVVTLAGCGVSHAPPNRNDPHAVLKLYLDKVVAGECLEAQALTAPTFKFGNGELCGLLHVTNYELSGEPARPNPNEVVFAATLTTAGGDASMPDGRHTWFYTLTLQPDAGWWISAGGSGP